MWTAGQIVSILEDYMGEVSDVKRLEFLSRAYKIMMNNDVSQLIYYSKDDIDSPFPLLKLADDTKFYTVDDNLVDSTGAAHTPTVFGTEVACRKISRVFTDQRINDIGYGYNDLFPEYFPFGEIAYLSTGENIKRYYEIPVSVLPAQGNNNASITFFEDPSKYGENIYVEFWIGAPKLSSNSSPILLDTDKWLQELINGAVGLYEDVVNGASQRLTKFYKEDLKKFRVERSESLRQKISMQFPARSVG